MRETGIEQGEIPFLSISHYIQDRILCEIVSLQLFTIGGFFFLTCLSLSTKYWSLYG